MSGVRVEIVDGVGLVTLDRPAKRNAFDGPMGRALGRAYGRLDEDRTVRVIVLTGTPPAFCAGADLSAGAQTFAAPEDPGFSASPITPPAFDLRTPVIAAVNGHAIGIGLTLALQADIRVMAAEGKYAIPQVRRGVIPDMMAHWTLPRIGGIAVAADLLLTGRTFDGTEAVSLGLASRCVPADRVLATAMDIASDIATNVAPRSAALSKRLLWDAARTADTPEVVAARETAVHRQLMGTPDAREGVRAHLERRAPRWAPAEPVTHDHAE
ncbi:enoyl-CoA hydratase/isomerase family protein [Nocardia sp. NPDC004123]